MQDKTRKCDLCGTKLPDGKFSKISFAVMNGFSYNVEETLLCPKRCGSMQASLTQLREFNFFEKLRKVRDNAN